VVAEPPARTLARTGGMRMPLLIGSNARELEGLHDMAQLDDAIDRTFGAHATEAKAFYAPISDPDPKRRALLLRASTDLAFACPSDFVAAAHSKAGNPTWQYEFDYALPGEEVSHASEIKFVMQAPASFPKGAPPLHDYWVNFARTGNPNGIGLAPWDAYAPRKGYIRFSDGKAEMKQDLRGEICRLRDLP
jgi:para-nitrobenzyl esterase